MHADSFTAEDMEGGRAEATVSSVTVVNATIVCWSEPTQNMRLT